MGLSKEDVLLEYKDKNYYTTIVSNSNINEEVPTAWVIQRHLFYWELSYFHLVNSPISPIPAGGNDDSIVISGAYMGWAHEQVVSIRLENNSGAVIEPVKQEVIQNNGDTYLGYVFIIPNKDESKDYRFVLTKRNGMQFSGIWPYQYYKTDIELINHDEEIAFDYRDKEQLQSDLRMLCYNMEPISNQNYILKEKPTLVFSKMGTGIRIGETGKFISLDNLVLSIIYAGDNRYIIKVEDYINGMDREIVETYFISDYQPMSPLFNRLK